MLKPRLVLRPQQALISLNEAKAHCRIEADVDDDDALVAGAVAAATDYLDGYSGVLGRALLKQTWVQEFSGFGCLRLVLGPVQSAVVSYFDATGAEIALADSVFVLREDALSPYVDLKPDQSWPNVQSRPDAVKVTYVCGVDSPGDVPESIRHAVKLLTGHYYENREAVGAAQFDLPMGVMALISPYMRYVR